MTHILPHGPFQGGAAGASNPAGNGAGFRDRSDGGDFIMRTRAYAWFDSRQQTEYGTLRSYLQVGVNYDSPNATRNYEGRRYHALNQVHLPAAAVALSPWTDLALTGSSLLNTSDTDRAKHRFPDIVQNWRVDQAWGSAQLMAAAHDVSGGYYAASGIPLFRKQVVDSQ